VWLTTKAKRAVERVPVAGPAVRRLGMAVVARSGLKVRDSATYWETRYRSGGTSGTGSSDRLAHFKAGVLNDFVRARSVRSVLESGCGDGSQLALADYPQYVGCDVAPAAVERCRRTFGGDPAKSFCLRSELAGDLTADLVLSLDVVYHLVEDEVFEQYMADLFDRSTRFVIVYSSDSESAAPGRHVRHRAFTRWVARNRPAWALDEKIDNPYPYDAARPHTTSFADFYVYAAPVG
jgi:SAM-dependent methyltransferase